MHYIVVQLKDAASGTMSLMAVVTADRARAQRAREVENALASVRMEGLEPSPEALAIFERYVDGELTSKEMGRALDTLLDSKYGPVRLPRDERSTEPAGNP
jgi:hypothetical protein